MCNLYSITTNQEAISRLFRVVNHYVGNLPPMPGVFPDYPVPVVRNAGDDWRTDHDALGHVATILNGGLPVNQHPLYVLVAIRSSCGLHQSIREGRHR
jgi:putative SOS response-associated peptidase YedK